MPIDGVDTAIGTGAVEVGGLGVNGCAAVALGVGITGALPIAPGIEKPLELAAVAAVVPIGGKPNPTSPTLGEARGGVIVELLGSV